MDKPTRGLQGEEKKFVETLLALSGLRSTRRTYHLTGWCCGHSVNDNFSGYCKKTPIENTYLVREIDNGEADIATPCKEHLSSFLEADWRYL